MEDESGLLAITFGPSGDEATSESVARDHQNEADFSKQKACWKPKVEDGDVSGDDY